MSPLIHGKNTGKITIITRYIKHSPIYVQRTIPCNSTCRFSSIIQYQASAMNVQHRACSRQ